MESMKNSPSANETLVNMADSQIVNSLFQQFVCLDHVAMPEVPVEINSYSARSVEPSCSMGFNAQAVCGQSSGPDFDLTATLEKYFDRDSPADNKSPEPIDSATKMYRFDEKHERFSPSHLLTQSNLHLAVKALPISEPIEIENLIEQEKALRISQGSELQEILVSIYDSNGVDSDLSDIPTDLNIDLHAIGVPADAGRIVGNKKMDESAWQIGDHSNCGQQAKFHTIDQSSISQHEEENVLTSSKELTVKPVWEVAAFRWSTTIQKLSVNHRNSFDRLLKSIGGGQMENSHRLGVLHAAAGQGATTLATCLAKLLSDEGARVLLADMDLDNPNLEEIANIQLKRGWQELLNSDESINEYLVRDSKKKLTLMPLAVDSDLESLRCELLNKMREISAQISSQFDHSIFDIGNAQNLMIDENCHVDFLDAVVIVSNSSNEESTAAMIYDKLVAAGVPAVVIAENFRNSSEAAA